MRDFFYLILAAFLEVGGDALVRFGLRGGRWFSLAAGAAILFAYGLSVNLPKWNFGRLMGVYIALFFLVSQLISVVVFKEKLHLPTLVGGVLIVTGGVLMTFWRVPDEIPQASLNADRPAVQSSE
jgi:small multidrug resistance family-3 protein